MAYNFYLHNYIPSLEVDGQKPLDSIFIGKHPTPFRRSQIDSVPFFKCEATKVERLKCQATLSSGAIIQIIGFMAVSSKDIEKLWKESSKSNSASDED